MMDTLLFLVAQQAPSNPVAAWLTLFTGLVAAVAVVGGLALLMARGWWAKTGDPMVKATVQDWYTQETQAKLRRAEIEAVVTVWYEAASRLSERRVFVNEAIENHLRRDDGLIRREIATSITKAVKPLEDALERLQQTLSARQDIDQQFRAELFSRLSHLEGLLAADRCVRDATVPMRRTPPSLPRVVPGGEGGEGG